MQRPPRPAVLALCLALSFAATGAHAEERVVGDGYAFDLPGRFQKIPSPWQVSARAMGETVVLTLPRRASGPVQMAFYTTPGPSLPEATLLVCRFELHPEDAALNVAALDVEEVRAAYQHAVETLPGAVLIDCRAVEFAAGTPTVCATIRYPHPDAGPRHVQSLVALRGTTGVVVTVDASAEMAIEYQAYFAELAETLRLIERAPTLEEQLRVPGLVAVALLFLVLVALVVRRRLRARRRKAPPPPTRILSCSPDFDGLGAVGPAPAAAAPGAAPAPEPASPASGAAPGVDAEAAAGAAPTPPAARPAAPAVRTATPPGPGRVLPTPAAPAGKTALKISRNTDFLDG